MCGIAGVIAPNGFPREHLALMSHALHHRGPDGFGYLVYSPHQGLHVSLNESVSRESRDAAVVGMAHRRLSIVDLSDASLQPMLDDSHTLCLSYNGEIYNYLELRQELEARGYTFRTTGDVEVLLRAYEAWGPDCLERCNGMWALSLLDLRSRMVVLSRDRFGIKPLYYTFHQDAIYFASEIKGLLAIPDLRAEPNESTVARYLVNGVADDSEETFFAGIKQFPAGHWAAVPFDARNLDVRPRRYWSLPAAEFGGNERDAIAYLRELFLDSVKRHAQCDVPVGTCLSGGLDSSAIVCAAEHLRSANEIPNYTHDAFGYCADDRDWSERPYMEMVVNATSAAMNYVAVNPERARAKIPEIVKAQDEPFGSASILAQWFVFERARLRGMTVMLDGQGADEILGGYHTYYITMAMSFLKQKQLRDYWSLRSLHESQLGPFPASHRMLLAPLVPPGLRRSVRRFRPRPELANQAYDVLTASLLESALADDRLHRAQPTSLRERLQVDVSSSVLPSLLRFEDRNSMAHSIEARVPFLDHRLVDFLFTLPDEWKIRGIETKYVLREAMKGILPEPIRTRKDKVGFKSEPDWTFAFVRQHRRELLTNETEFERRWFDPAGLARRLEGVDRTIETEFLQWRILNTKLWVRQHWGDAQRHNDPVGFRHSSVDSRVA